MRRKRFNSNPSAAESSAEGLWAVSYADLLMVVLSFFIVFFQFDDSKKTGSALAAQSKKNESSEIQDRESVHSQKDVLAKIRQSFRLNLSSKPSQDVSKLQALSPEGAGSRDQHSDALRDTSGSPDAETGKASPQGGVASPVRHFKTKEILAEIAANVQDSDLRWRGANFDGNEIILDLPNDLYPPGKMNLNSEGKQLLLRALESLRPFQNELTIAFVGFADSKPIVHLPAAYFDSNRTVGSVRASRALSIATEHGFREEFLTSEGGTSAERESRTLSLRIRVRPVEEIPQ